MPSSWKGYITFGLVSIPINLSPAARTERISFNQLHKVCHTRLKQPLFCPHCERIVDRSEVEKGYEYAKDQYVMFTPQELEEVEPESARVMDILEFVKLEEIDPFYFDASYYIAPEDAGVQAYHLLLNAMRKLGYAGIAKVAMHNREYIVIIRARKNGLALHTMFYSNEIRAAGEIGSRETQPREQEEALAIQLIKSLAAPFKPEKYMDAYQAGLQQLIDAKVQGKTVPVTPHKKIAPVIDLMAALKSSLGKVKPAEAEEEKDLVRVLPKVKKEEAGNGKKRRKVG
jgi:DNA end-binding protein Ku